MLQCVANNIFSIHCCYGPVGERLSLFIHNNQALKVLKCCTVQACGFLAKVILMSLVYFFAIVKLKYLRSERFGEVPNIFFVI